MYFKIFTDNPKYNKYKYHTGMNISLDQFNFRSDYENDFLFTDEKHILKFCYNNNKIAEVIIPEGETVVRIGDNYKAHRIILGEIKDLWEVETFKWLTECGVDIYTNDNFALRCAAKEGYLEIVKYLIENGANGDYSIRYAAMFNHLETVKYLIENGANIHTDDDAALRWASEDGHLEIVKYLVKNGADIHVKNNIALQRASIKGHLEVVKYLVENGADIHANNDYALRCAIKNQNFEVVEYLKKTKLKEEMIFNTIKSY